MNHADEEAHAGHVCRTSGSCGRSADPSGLRHDVGCSRRELEGQDRRFEPRRLVDVTNRLLETNLFGTRAKMPPWRWLAVFPISRRRART